MSADKRRVLFTIAHRLNGNERGSLIIAKEISPPAVAVIFVDLKKGSRYWNAWHNVTHGDESAQCYFWLFGHFSRSSEATPRDRGYQNAKDK